MIEQDNGNGYAFFPVGGQVAEPAAQGVLNPAEPSIIEGEFKEIPPEASSANRALVVHGAAQPADSRLASALRQHALAKTRAGRAPQGGQNLPWQAVELLHRAFIEDPEGTAALAGLQQEWSDRLRAQTEHEQWQREEYARRLAEERERGEQEKKRHAKEEIDASIRRLLGLDKTEKPAANRQHISFVEEDRVQTLTQPPRLVDPIKEEREREAEQAATAKPDFMTLLSMKKKATPPEPPAQSWWSKHLGTPKKSVWR